MTYVIDASVFVSALRPPDVHYSASQDFMSQLRVQAATLYCPTLVLAECAGAIARPTGDPALAQQAVTAVRATPLLHLISTTIVRAQQAAKLAAEYRLRGTDAIYVAVVAEFGATLVTWDAEMRQRGANAVTTLTPSEWIASVQPPP